MGPRLPSPVILHDHENLFAKRRSLFPSSGTSLWSGRGNSTNFFWGVGVVAGLIKASSMDWAVLHYYCVGCIPALERSSFAVRPRLCSLELIPLIKCYWWPIRVHFHKLCGKLINRLENFQRSKRLCRS